uniref:Reverse transcriptase domain-containing protein n=1 Tax=Echeneis naucrates TaxID=173247 RepID=A0A665USM5_ECHNA
MPSFSSHIHSIKKNQKITGITLFSHDFKANLYTNDILLTLSGPAHSVPHLLKFISDYGRFSGYKINWSKSEVLKKILEPPLTFQMVFFSLYIYSLYINFEKYLTINMLFKDH